MAPCFWLFKSYLHLLPISSFIQCFPRTYSSNSEKTQIKCMQMKIVFHHSIIFNKPKTKQNFVGFFHFIILYFLSWWVPFVDLAPNREVSWKSHSSMVRIRMSSANILSAILRIQVVDRLGSQRELPCSSNCHRRPFSHLCKSTM